MFDNLSESDKKRYRDLAKLGYGDDVVHEGGETWVLFRTPSFTIGVKQFGGSYTDVKVWPRR